MEPKYKIYYNAKERRYRVKELYFIFYVWIKSYSPLRRTFIQSWETLEETEIYIRNRLYDYLKKEDLNRNKSGKWELMNNYNLNSGENL